MPISTAFIGVFKRNERANIRGISSIGRVRRSQRRGTGIETRILQSRPCGAMDSALDFGSSGCGFESHQGRISGLAQRKRVGLITQRSEDRNLYPLKPSWRSWQRVGLIILRSPVRSWQRAFVHAPVAQSAAHEPYVLRVLGSNPSWSTKGPWCSGSTWDSESHDPGSNPGGPSLLASMAEWSKAFDSSSNIRMNAWVRIPLDAVLTDSMAEWLRRVIRNHMGVARGSSNLSAVVLLFVLQLVSSLCFQNQ